MLYLSVHIYPPGTRENILEQLDKWEREGVEGHFTEPTPWLTIDDIVKESMARVVGGRPSEVVMMNSLTCNIHFMMVSFYRPSSTRFKILMERKAFPSDRHAVVSQILHHKLDPSDTLIEIAPREGETNLRHEDIIRTIQEEGDRIALVFFSGVQYYTGQLFNMEEITSVAHEKGCEVGFDLAHAVGNVPLQLHDWNVDFACWCSYKYLNCGPGSIGGCFVHDRHTTSSSSPSNKDGAPPRLAGWWGHRLSDRFQMDPDFVPEDGVNGFRVSNPPVLLVAGARASLDLFDKVSESDTYSCVTYFAHISDHLTLPTSHIHTHPILTQAGMDRLRKKSILLTGYLEALLRTELSDHVDIFTPADPHQRGCQLSLSFKVSVEEIHAALQAEGVVCDVRKPNVMRVAPAPLYNSFSDVFEFVNILKSTLQGRENGPGSATEK